MRRQPTPAEALLWQELRAGKLEGLKFRRQHALGRFIVDFYCVRAALVVEVDGPVHEDQVEADAERDAHLESLGLIVIRFSNHEVMTMMDSVRARIKKVADERLRRHLDSPSPQEGEGVGGEVSPTRL